MNIINLGKKSIKIKLLDGKIEVLKYECQSTGVTWKGGVASDGELARFVEAMAAAGELAKNLDQCIVSLDDYQSVTLSIEHNYRDVVARALLKDVSGLVALYTSPDTHYEGNFVMVYSG